MTAQPIKKGDIVRYWFDTGAFGQTILNGIVEKACAKTFTVRWISGLRNRIRYDDPRTGTSAGVALETVKELIEEFRLKYGGAK